MLRAVITAVALTVALLLPVGAPSASARTCVPPEPEPLLPVAATSPVGQETWVRWTRASREVRYGSTAVLQGQVVTDDGALGGVDVRLLAQPAGESGWTRVATAKSDPETGVFGFGCLEPRRTTTYRAVFDGDLLYAASESSHRVGVARLVPDAMRRKGESRFVYTGSVSPRYRGRVLLQRLTADGSWRRIAVDRAGSRSRWRFVLDGRPGRYRALVPADDRFIASPSDHVWRITRG